MLYGPPTGPVFGYGILLCTAGVLGAQGQRCTVKDRVRGQEGLSSQGKALKSSNSLRTESCQPPKPTSKASIKVTSPSSGPFLPLSCFHPAVQTGMKKKERVSSCISICILFNFIFYKVSESIKNEREWNTCWRQ